ncbi:MAG: hypothetical protein HKP58_17005 [Desulfatitalea sp.]|nr:hypothetical protein [Desulfatitalea sp.]NNK02113.1 hypothetical protein [Desulfatitalea sp.]
MLHSHQAAQLPAARIAADEYHRVEFALQAPIPVYQFKLWRTEHNDMFLLVKDDSSLLPRLKEGHIVPMTYLSNGTNGGGQIRETRIDRIIDERAGRFQGHHRVELAVLPAELATVRQ